METIVPDAEPNLDPEENTKLVITFFHKLLIQPILITTNYLQIFCSKFLTMPPLTLHENLKNIAAMA